MRNWRKWQKYLLIALFLAVAGAFSLVQIKSHDTAPEPPVKSLTGLEQRLGEVEIDKLTIDPNDQTLEVDEAEREQPYRIATPALGDEEGLNRILRKAHKLKIEIAARPLSNEEGILPKLLRILPTVLVLVVLVGVLLYMNGGFGRMKITPARSDTTFDDVAGAGEAVSELDEIRAFLSEPERFRKLGARVPKGVLLYGPPGTGKTLLAKATAHEAGVPFFAASGSEFVEMYVGLGSRRVRQLFERAKEVAPSIIFIDELDAVGGHRARGGGDGGTREADQTLVQLLKEMDGFDVAKDPVIVIGATNRLEALDRALTRPGRFDRHISIDPPDRHGRLEILKVHARDKSLADGVDLKRLATQTAGMSGAELELILNEAALVAARKKRSVIDASALDDAFFRVVAGAVREHQMLSDKERRTVAYHECGHALVQELLGDETNKVHKISIIPRGRSGGQTLIVSEDDVFLYTEQALRDQICGLLAGRAAEMTAFGEVSSGAADDLSRATDLARKMIAKLGMGESLGLVVESDDRELPEEISAALEAEVRQLLDSEYARARQLLSSHHEALDRIAGELLEVEIIDRDRFLEILGELRLAPAERKDAGPGPAAG